MFTRPYLEKNHHKKRTGGVAQGVGLEFKPQYQTTTTKTAARIPQDYLL
jgi:hypothetical protein